jgi:hypothetical protein
MKVFGRHIPFTQRESKALTDEQILEMLGSGIPTASGVAVSAETALRTPAVAAAVRTIAEACASLAVKVVAIAADGTETEATNHEAGKLLKGDVNDWQSGFELSAPSSLMPYAGTRADLPVSHDPRMAGCSKSSARAPASSTLIIPMTAFSRAIASTATCSRPDTSSTFAAPSTKPRSRFAGKRSALLSSWSAMPLGSSAREPDRSA